MGLFIFSAFFGVQHLLLFLPRRHLGLKGLIRPAKGFLLITAALMCTHTLVIRHHRHIGQRPCVPVLVTIGYFFPGVNL